MIASWIAAGALVLGDILVRAVRLRLLTGRPASLPVPGAAAVNALGDAASAITPARLGGEPARWMALARAGVPSGVALAALAAERLVDMSLAVLVTLALLPLLGRRGLVSVETFATRFASPGVLPWVVVVAAVTLVSGAIALRLRHRFPSAATRSLREAVRHARGLSRGTVTAAAALTGLSMAARVAILPVLLVAYGPNADPALTWAGSFVLIYAQLLLPTPAGAGGVELAFVVGVAPLLSSAQTAGLLLTWRLFTLAVPVALGLVVVALRRTRART